MKKIIFKSFLLLWTVLLACSCNDLLDEKAYDFVSPEQLGDSESAASQLVTGAYNTVITSLFAPGSLSLPRPIWTVTTHQELHGIR